LLCEERLIFDKIGFFNVGYWQGVNDSIEIAQINLIETLVRFLSKDGNILDVACGKGASTKFLTKYFNPSGITGINISATQLKVCKVIAPECQFKLMDATSLEYEGCTFDNVLCIEAGLHFSTRYKFFEEAYRVLRPGGRLAMLDFLRAYDRLDEIQAAILPRENYLPNLDAYRDILRKVGFKYVRIEDCTESTIKAATNYVIRVTEMEFGKRSDREVLDDIQKARAHADSFIAGGIVYAIK
jgi:ubiquinone/menaquinone biosynthesis C-methylase UbiE